MASSSAYTRSMVPATPQTSKALGLPSEWSSSIGEPPLLDLSFLTEEEIKKIKSVLQADEDLRTRDRIRLGTLRQEIQQNRTHQKEIAGILNECTCCEREFGKVFNTGAVCLSCGNKVCKRCRKIPYIRPPKFVCDVCAKQKLLDLQSKDYFPTTTIQPSNTANDEPQAELTVTEIQPVAKTEESFPPLYGSELVMRSLDLRQRSHSHQPTPHKDPLPSITSSSSLSSSIVVRYENRSESEGRSRSPSPSRRQSNNSPLSTSARKVSANELMISDEESEEETTRRVSVPLMDHLKRSDSMGSLGSMTSMYSAAGGKGDYDISGDVLIGVWHKDNQLFVRVIKARGLAAAKKGVTSDPYIKTYLLPDRSKYTKRKTSIQRKTINPVYNEILKNKLARNEISSHTLWLSVWDWDRFGRNQFLGEVCLPLSTVDLTDSSEHWYSLQDKDESVNDDDFYKGKIRLSLKLEPSIDYRGKTRKGVGSLHIKIHQAQEIPKMNPLGLTDATVKCYLLPNRSSSGKRKTQVVKNNLNPVWEEEFRYDFLTVKELSSERVLEVTVWDFDRRGSNDFIGGLRLGPTPGRSGKHKEWMDSIGEEITHWESVLSRPGEWVEVWHTLRPTMTPLGKQESILSSRRTGLSPVKELSPTRELEVEESTPAVVEGFAFTPPVSPWHDPITPSQPHKDTPSQPHPVTQTAPKVLDKDTPSQPHSDTPSQPLPVTQTAPKASDTDVTSTSSQKASPISSREISPIPEVIISSESNLKREDYFGSQASVYSEAGGKGDYDITGEVLFGVHYKSGHLLVHVNKAKELAAADSNGYSDPYVKTYLLPDKSKHSKKKTDVKKKTLFPVYNETLKYKVSQTDLVNRTLWLSVWDWDRLGRNQFLGEIRLPLSTLDLTDSSEHWHTLQDKGSQSVSTLAHASNSEVLVPAAGEDPLISQTATSSVVADSTKSVPTSTKDEDLEPLPLRRSSPVVKETPENWSAKKKIPPRSFPIEEHHEEHPASAVIVDEHNEFTEQPVKPKPTAILSGLATKRYGSGSLASFGSQASVYSAAGGKGDYDITGEVLFGVHYIGGHLLVHVNKAKELAAADSNGFSDPYIKTYLLPDKSKHSKKKTAIKKKTLCPVYNETLKYKVAFSELANRTLWLSVWDFDRLGRNQFLGEIRLPLSTLDLTDSSEHWHTLQDKDESSLGGVDTIYHGEIKLGMKFDFDRNSNKKGNLHISVKQAKDLPVMDANGLTNAYVKGYLLPNRGTSGKRKTTLIKNNLNPVWEERFSYEGVTFEELSRERVLEITVWDHDKSGNDFIGGLRLGPAPGRAAKHKEWMDSIGEEITHWESVLSSPGKWVEVWHTLRSSMNPRQIDLSVSPPPLIHSSLPFKDEPKEVSPLPVEEPSPSGQRTSASPSPPLEFKKTSVRQRIPFPDLVPKRSPESSPEPERRHKEHSIPDHPPPSSHEDTSKRESVPIKPVDHSTPLINIGDLSRAHGGQYLEEIETEEEPKPKDLTPLQTSGLLGLKHADSAFSFGSQASVYSEAGGKGDYDITGEVLFGVHYKSGHLLVHVNKAKELAAADSNGFSDPYIKTYLLPDKSKHSKKKTAIKKKTLNPVYNETLKYKVSSSELSSRTLWLSVWDWDRFGRNQFLGEIRLPLSTLDLTDSSEHYYSLQDKDEGGDGATYHGQVQLSMMFSPSASEKKGKSKKTKGTLNVAVKQARDLPRMQSSGTTDAFIKCYLLPDKSSTGKRKTGVIKNNLNPVWGTTFSYEKVSLEELSTERVLELVVWDFNKGGSSDFIGGLRLGPAPGRAAKHKEWMDSIGEEVIHWESVFSRPGEWVEVWHTLRTSMDYRSVSF